MNIFSGTINGLFTVLATLCIINAAASFNIAAFAAGPADETSIRNAWSFYTKQNYAASADAFDKLISTSTPGARLYYYAALANRACNRNARAKQLCQYIITNFSAAPESGHAQKLFPELAPRVASSDVPDALKGKSVAELMTTEEGRKHLQQQLEKKEAAATAQKAEAAKVSPMLTKWRSGRPGEKVFTAADIAKEGAGGIDQMYYPNCWFESSMSALAMLPRGQKLMADMVTYGDQEGSYVVRFPGDGQIYKITEKDLEKTGIHNKSLWATLIEAAQTMKFPDDEGGYLDEGLHSITGKPARMVATSEGGVEALIDGAVRAGQPVICGTRHDLSGLPRLAVPGHAYTITGFDPRTGMVTIRNPHGVNSQRFSLKGDERHEKFEQLDDGVFKMQLTLFKAYFSHVASANL